VINESVDLDDQSHVIEDEIGSKGAAEEPLPCAIRCSSA